ncbi:MAG: 50S ribosomal protein L4 [Bacteroidetes bacterium]|nr:50S ribosomal protein L4 [Bacteroidota bacterium]
MELAVYNIDGKKTAKTVNLNDEIFGIEPNDHVIYLDVKQYLANKRQGTHKSKERNEVAGSTRKLRRQKGTGGARIGDIKAPTLRGGGRIFGPKPRDYSFKLNKKVKILARKSALTYKVKENNLMIIEDFSFEQPKTKQYISMLNNLSLSDKKSLLVIPDVDRNIILSARNLPKTSVVLASDLNTYQILDAQRILLVESSIEKIENTLLK